MNIFKKTFISPIGKLLIECSQESLLSLKFSNEIYNDDHFLLNKVENWLCAYFNGNKMCNSDFNFELNGTVFHKEVWNELIKIPYGETITYGDLAKIIAKRRNIKRMSSQAIGKAVSKNPIAIIIPCHRVLGKDSKLTGYAYGLDAKKYLLDLEKISYKE